MPTSAIQPKKGLGRILRKFQGYYLEDIECKFCPQYRGKARGCPLIMCEFEQERQEAIESGRIERPYKRITDW